VWSSRWFELLKRMGSALNRWAYCASNGRFAGSYRGVPILLLTTTGRKSNKPRTWPLLYFRNQGRYILIASNGGADYHPAWLLNLREHRQATIEIGRNRIDVIAEEAIGKERERLWWGASRAYPGYVRYQSRTNREIPVMILTIEPFSC
jgi:deazaflavin-dependent oxidoreductase (nitroreductase family)